MLSSLLIACSPLPDTAEIETIFIEYKLSNGFSDLFDLQAFKKTNGFHQSDNFYVVDVEYDLTFKKGLSDVLSEIAQDRWVRSMAFSVLNLSLIPSRPTSAIFPPVIEFTAKKKLL